MAKRARQTIQLFSRPPATRLLGRGVPLLPRPGPGGFRFFIAWWTGRCIMPPRSNYRLRGCFPVEMTGAGGREQAE
jgi:hypothetical protein